MPAAYAAAIGAAGSLIGGAMQSGAISGAADQANARAQQAIDQTRGLYQPFIDTGQTALTQQSNLLGLGGQDAATKAMSTFQASPGYQYQLQQGLRGVDAGAAARGMLRSGATLQAEQTLGNNLANQDFGNYFNRLNGLTNFGFGATNNFANVLSGQATNQEQIATQAGTQLASIYGNTAKNLQGVAGTAYQNGLFGNNQNPFDAAGLTAPTGTAAIPTGTSPFAVSGFG